MSYISPRDFTDNQMEAFLQAVADDLGVSVQTAIHTAFGQLWACYCVERMTREEWVASVNKLSGKIARGEHPYEGVARNV